MQHRSSDSFVSSSATAAKLTVGFDNEPGKPTRSRWHFQSKRQQRKLVAHFRTVSKNFVLLLASVLQYTPNLSWTIQRTLLWVLSVWTLFGVCVNSLTQKRRRLLGILQYTDSISVDMDMVDTKYGGVYAIEFDAF